MHDSRYFNIASLRVLSLLFAACTMPFIGIYNKYIFLEENVIFLLPLLLLFAFFSLYYRMPRASIPNNIVLVFCLFVVYMLIRLNDMTMITFDQLYFKYDTTVRSGLVDIIHTLTFIGLLFISAYLFYNKNMSNTLWIVICGYMLAFMLRNSTADSQESLYYGYNISAGLTVYTLCPFIFLRAFSNKSKWHYLPHILMCISILWVAHIRSRGPLSSMIIFYILYLAWPIIIKTQYRFITLFIGALSLLLVGTCVYMIVCASDVGDNINSISLNVFDKSINTRYVLWRDLVDSILEHPWFGYGTDHSSYSFSPSVLLLRENLEAHNLFIELLIRMGVVGLTLFLMIFFCIWKFFWTGRHELGVRIAGSFIISSLFFANTAVYWLFNLPLRSGFGWIILGIGAGACLRVKAREQNGAAASSLKVKSPYQNPVYKAPPRFWLSNNLHRSFDTTGHENS